jgi:integrase
MDTSTPATAPATPVTVSDILNRYERECLPKLAPQTIRDYTYHLEVLHREFGSRAASELEPKDFGPWMRTSERGVCYRVRSLAVLSAAFTQAVSFWYILPRNVLRDVKRPKNKPRDRLISDEEFQRLRAMAHHRIALAMDLALLTGQRQGDILRFRWDQIRDGALHLRQSKTGKRLAIELTPELKKVLGKCWMLKNGGKDGNEYVLPTHTGKPYKFSGFRSGWQYVHRKWVKAGGEPLHFHDIRGMAATKCATPEIAMRLLGHTTIAMTMRVYRRGVERVEALRL